MQTKDEQLLNEYKKEIFGARSGTSTLTIAELIDSHRELRTTCQEYRTRWHDLILEAENTGKNLGYQEVVNGEYLKKTDLKAMTVLELANLLSDQMD